MIKAHSVQRSGAGLNTIARKGHVYGYKFDFTRLDRTGGRIEPTLLGISDASTFTGFCGYHDSETFAPLERAQFGASPEQVALLAYRAVCKELMAKRSSVDLNPFMREGDRGLPPALQELWQVQMDAQQVGLELALKDLEAMKARLEAAITAADYADVHALVVTFDAPPEVLATAPITPDFDFAGVQLQDLLKLDHAMEVLTFSLVGTGDGRGAAVFSWSGSSPVAERFCASLQAISLDDMPHRLVQFAFEYFENVFWSPEWWDSLDEKTKATLLQRINSQVTTIRGPELLYDDGTRSATWHVTRVIRF